MPRSGEMGQVSPSDQMMTEGIDWRRYEDEKRKLREMGLSPKEYERRVKELAARLGR